MDHILEVVSELSHQRHTPNTHTIYLLSASCLHNLKNQHLKIYIDNKKTGVVEEDIEFAVWGRLQKRCILISYQFTAVVLHNVWMGELTKNLDLMVQMLEIFL